MNDLPWLVALDIDGTTLRHDGSIGDAVTRQIRRLDAMGHQVMLATGRSHATTLPVVERLGITPRFLVCANGARTLAGERWGPTGYRHVWVKSFDPTEVLQAFRLHLKNVRFAVEDELGHYRCTGLIPDATIGPDAELVEFGDLLNRSATRVVAMVPDHDIASFREVVRRVGPDDLSYAFGWTAWVDMSAAGVNKSSALERVRVELGITRERVMAVGDGRNDIEMLRWAGERGRGVAMGHAPEDVIDVASELTGTVADDGLAHVLATLV